MKDDDDEKEKGKDNEEKDLAVIPIKNEEKEKSSSDEEEEVEIVELRAEEGAIVFKKKGMDLIVPTGEITESDADYFDEVINTITFMLYALEREDWKEEFISVLQKQVQKEEEADREAEISRRRSHLKVIK